MSDTPPPSAANAAGTDALADKDSANVAAVNDNDNDASTDASSNKDATDDNAFDDANNAVVDNNAMVNDTNNYAAVVGGNNNAAKNAVADAPTTNSTYVYIPANTSDSDQE